MILDRQLADSLAGHGEDRIGHGRGDADRARLANAAWGLDALNEMHLDQRYQGTFARSLVDAMRASGALAGRE